MDTGAAKDYFNNLNEEQCNHLLNAYHNLCASMEHPATMCDRSTSMMGNILNMAASRIRENREQRN